LVVGKVAVKAVEMVDASGNGLVGSMESEWVALSDEIKVSL
jgi:hypothetical protein